MSENTPAVLEDDDKWLRAAAVLAVLIGGIAAAVIVIMNPGATPLDIGYAFVVMPMFVFIFLTGPTLLRRLLP